MSPFEVPVCTDRLVNLPAKFLPEKPGEDREDERGATDDGRNRPRQDLNRDSLRGALDDAVAEHVSNLRDLDDGVDEATSDCQWTMKPKEERQGPNSQGEIKDVQPNHEDQVAVDDGVESKEALVYVSKCKDHDEDWQGGQFDGTLLLLIPRKEDSLDADVSHGLCECDQEEETSWP